MKYRSTTRNIEVVVEPHFLEEETDPDENRYFWAYSIGIINHREDVVQLRSRYWLITDANGAVEEVRGPGVVGEEPVLQPGEIFEYTSGCPLTTPSGIMVGEYQMETQTGERFDVDIPAFSLDIPDAPRVLN